MKALDMKDISIIDAFPVYGFSTYGCEKIILNVGCGEGILDYHLAWMGYRVYATDIKKHETWEDNSHLTFHVADIFDLSSFPVSAAPVVICSQVLEHIKNYEQALINLIKLTEIRLILSIPCQRSYYDNSHINFWNDDNIQELIKICRPYSVSLSKILKRSKDIRGRHRGFLLIIDKRQVIIRGQKWQ